MASAPALTAPAESAVAAIEPTEITPWVCRPEIAPRPTREDGALLLESNGSEGCYGGWELVYERSDWPSARVTFQVEAEATDLPRGTDALVIEAFWDSAVVKAETREVEWEPIVPRRIEPAGDRSLRVSFSGVIRVPRGATALRVRCGLRWTPRGTVRWHGWRLDNGPEPGEHRRLRLGVASAKPGPWVDSETNIRHYLQECRRAGEAGVELVCLPEVITTFNMPASPQATVAAARPIPGDWLQPFQDVARTYRMGICFSANERAGANGEVVYNTAVLIGRDGSFIGKYRKVHLALSEARKGVAAGHEFPVFDFHGVRVGLAICMDSSPLESARILAQQGAEVLLMPIMGDFRATPWQLGAPRFHRERWEAVQRAHAMDNHLYVVVARNGTEGSAVTAPWGEIVAYDDGTQGVIWADVDVDDHRSHPRGSTMRSVLWSMRRPAVYGALTEAAQSTVP